MQQVEFEGQCICGKASFAAPTCAMQQQLAEVQPAALLSHLHRTGKLGLVLGLHCAVCRVVCECSRCGTGDSLL